MAVTKEDLAEYCGLTQVPAAGPKLVEFERFLAAAHQHVAARTGRVAGTTVLTVTGRGTGTLILPVAFCAAIGTVTSPSGQVVTPTSVDAVAGIVKVPSAERGVWQVQVLGSAMPADLELAVLEIGRHLYNSQRVSLRPDQRDGATVPAFSIPNRARDLMAPYVLPAIA